MNSIVANDSENALYPDIKTNFVSETTITAGTSPLILDVFGTVGWVANRGHVANDGTGTIQLQTSSNGTDYNTAWSLKSGETYDMTGMDVKKLKITRGAADSSVRVMLW